MGPLVDLRAGAPPFEYVIEQHGPALLRFCVARIGVERGEDCFQETMIAALRSYGELRDPAAVRTWLFTIAARKATDLYRLAQRQPVAVADIEQLSGIDVTAPEHSHAELWELVRALPDKQRQAVTLRYLGDLTHREIAQVMETSEQSARRNVFEALRHLRESNI